LTVITYIYAVVCVQFSAEWLTFAEGQPTSSTEGTLKFLRDNFPSLGYSIYTLFKAVSGGVSWGELSDPMIEVSLIVVLTFPFFICVTVFCVLNIVTAAFVEAAARKTQEDEALALEHIAERRKWIKVIKDIFRRHDTDQGGSLDWQEFASIMTDWRTKTALENIGVDVSYEQAKILFRFFDWDGNGRIDINEFAQGVHHLKGNARSLDVFRQFHKLSRQVDKLAKAVRNRDDSTGGRPSFRRSHSMGSSSMDSLASPRNAPSRTTATIGSLGSTGPL
jgi:hypothetical protein